MPAPAIRTAAATATRLESVGWIEIAAYPKATNSTSSATPRAAAAIRRKSPDNTFMTAVSQALVDFANGWRQPPAPGFEVIDTPRYRVVLQPDFPIAGPNSASWIRCRAEEADEVIDEVSSLFRERDLPLMWVLDPDTEPANFADYLAAHGFHPDRGAPRSAVMVLGIDAHLEAPRVAGLELRDGLADLESFRGVDAVNAEAFEGRAVRGDVAYMNQLERRRQNQLAAGNRRVILATINGEAAGSSGLSLYLPDGAIITGGAVRPKFRGLGIYRAMVAARLEMAREAGAAGLSVWGGPMSAPILARLGFETVGYRRFYRALSN
jgi:GNAT superfamily N-acetyltransferase